MPTAAIPLTTMRLDPDLGERGRESAGSEIAARCSCQALRNRRAKRFKALTKKNSGETKVRLTG